MFSVNLKQRLLLIGLLLIVGCGGSQAEEETEVESADSPGSAQVSPVVILIVDDFGPPAYHLAVGDLVAPDIFQLSQGVEIEANFQLAPDFLQEATTLRGQLELALPEGSGVTDGLAPVEEVAVPLEDGADFMLEPVPYRLLAPLVTGTCLSTPDGLPHFAAEGMAHVRALGMAHVRALGMAELLAGRPHGSLVRDQLRRSLEAGGAVHSDDGLVGFDLFADKPWLRDIELWQTGEAYIVLATIDTDGFSTEVIAPRISDSLAIFTDESSMKQINERWDTGDVYVAPARGAVINMSFSLIPCDLSFGQLLANSELMAAYRLGLPNALELAPQFSEPAVDELAAVEAQSGENLSPEEGQLLQNELFYQLESAPVLAQPEFRKTIIDLSYGYDIHDLTALRFLSDCDAADKSEAELEEMDPLCRVLEADYDIPVIPVAAAGNFSRSFPFFPAAWSSTVSIGATGADYSNRSEVTLDGSYDLTLEDGSVANIGGTSFAAPRFSYLAALYLLREGSDSCTENGNTTTPPLGYAGTEGPWANGTVEEVAAGLCQSFLAAGEVPDTSGEDSYLDRAMAGEFAGGVVELMSQITGAEADKMTEALKPFEQGTGIDVDFVGTDDLPTQLQARVDAGESPDIADLPDLSLLQRFAAGGYIVDVGDFLPYSRLRQNYIQSWLDLATVQGPDGAIMGGVWHRAMPKSLVWYPRARFEEAGYQLPATWDELLWLTEAMAEVGDPAWCIGIESGSATGWVVTDWIENITLRTTSLQEYDSWLAGELPFASSQVQKAVEIMSEIWFNDAYVYGGRSSIVTTNFLDAPLPMFADPPGCWLHLQGPWIRGFFPELEPGVDYDFFPLPPIDPAYGRPVLAYGNIMAMFKDTPEARALMEYFSTGASVEAWARSGGSVSPHLDSNLDGYADALDRKAAQILLNADSVRLDASDLMPGEVGAGSFWKLMTDYVDGTVDLDTALQEIDDSWP